MDLLAVVAGLTAARDLGGALRAIGGLADVMAVARLLDHVSLLYLIDATWAHLDLLIANVIIVLLVLLGSRGNFVGLEARAGDGRGAPTPLGRVVPHARAISVTVGEGAAAVLL